MKKYSITCSLGHRLFDIEEGSNMIIRIKCANQKTCPHKSICGRKTEIVFGEPPGISGKLEHYVCPACGKRIFDVVSGSRGAIQIKCAHCGRVVQIAVGMNRTYRQAI